MHFRIFDCWRLAAAFLIMAYHFLFNAPAGAAHVIEFLYRLSPLLDMFFMMSGFFIAARYGRHLAGPADYAAFLRRRVARIYPLHVLILAFFTLGGLVIAAGWATPGDPQRWSFSELPLQLLGLHALGFTDTLAFNYVSWSVSAELFCYVLFPLIVVAFRFGGLNGLLLLLAVWVAGLELASARGVFPDGHWTSANTLGAYRAFADFILGAIIAVLVERRVLDTRSHLPGMAFLAFAVVAMMSGLHPYAAILGFVGAMHFTALAETARPDSTRALAVLSPVTRVSFGIYLLHPVMETLFLTLLWKRWLEETGTVDFYVFWLVPMAATVLAAMASDRYLEPRLGRLIAGTSGRVRAPRAAPA